jgi:hypothetical protein
MTLSHEKQRLKYFLWELIKTYQPNCCICHLPFLYEDILPSRGVDNLTEHHLNGIHDTILSNKRLAHRICQRRHHIKDNLHKPSAAYLTPEQRDRLNIKESIFEEEHIPPAGLDSFGNTL